jgi:hypothetical protein
VRKLCVTRKLRRTDAAPSYVLVAGTYGRNYEEEQGGRKDKKGERREGDAGMRGYGIEL